MICPDCGGTGEKAYANTAGWRGGIGGMMITESTCNKCWGSGDSEKPNRDLRLPPVEETSK